MFDAVLSTGVPPSVCLSVPGAPPPPLIPSCHGLCPVCREHVSTLLDPEGGKEGGGLTPLCSETQLAETMIPKSYFQFEIIINVFLLHLNTYVMDLRPSLFAI